MRRILWIDDDARLIKDSTPIFLKYGFRVIGATNTSRALGILRKESVDGVLLDVRLKGGEDGLELLEEIHHLYPSLKVVVFTGYPAYGDHARAARLGASVYFDKINKSIPLEPRKQREFFSALNQLFQYDPGEGPPPREARRTRPMNKATGSAGPRRKVFIGYSHLDARWLSEFRRHLVPLEENGLIVRWDDTVIKPGQYWQREIDAALRTAKVAVLLVSDGFMASEYVRRYELPAVLAAAAEVTILPIILGPCDLGALSQFQAVNSPSKTVAEMTKPNRARVWLKATQRITETLAGK